MATIRLASRNDREAINRIALVTGNAGEDASDLHENPNIVGDIYAAPYLEFAPDLSFALELGGQVLGYCVGTQDTRQFEMMLEENWWPGLRKAYPKPKEVSDWSADDQFRNHIHAPPKTPNRVAGPFPGHLHLNLLKAARGIGAGRRLVETWVRKAEGLGVPAAHVGVDARNSRATEFWSHLSFSDLPDSCASTLWMGRNLE